jgi:hypothetical protein
VRRLNAPFFASVHGEQSEMPDPLFQAIEQHRAAVERVEALPDDARDAALDEPCEDERTAYAPLFTTAPTTAAGVAALFEHLAERDQLVRARIQSAVDDWDGRSRPDGGDWLAMLAEAIRKAR